ncbi:tRNA pseudouridine synthase A [[Leptolyngbya] sp. PCC 7376]|uniref:tRNA pseudouridine(38-40) synthase TruA n=1 Tax=[Leptolyngbya] sp. PCC 7376 TaxID=111781 RepID=UPI00029EE87E|nr:tRNA pseudouridine(38-40) synthase TruA [[Leptolyngbya] sp. PCC 7376]AFY40560.1 tRNA pseudouridine synthase A [[Leptolyngbya] sp. PCC 7376]
MSVELSNHRKRVAMVVQYLGTNFYGWQKQKQGRTVQGVIEDTLTGVLSCTTKIHGAGRTDSGVHAAGQFAHFDCESPIPGHKWAKILNDRLPDDIVIRASTEVETDWHSQFSALWRRYRYTLYTHPAPNLFVQPLAWHYYQAPLDETLIQEAMTPLMGRHHLAAFHRSGSQRTHSWVEVQAAECSRRGSFIHIEIQANGFLYGMVRLLVGLLVDVGQGKRSLEDFKMIWSTERRDLVKYSAPAKGLCLLRVGYPKALFPAHLWFDTQPTFLLSH